MAFDCDVLVIGAGISGLAAAWRLQRASRKVRVIDSAGRVGGVIGTRRRDGALYELGPNSTLDTTPLVNELLDGVGIRGERIDADALAKRRFVVRDGKLVALPTSPPALLSSSAFSMRAKLRVLREPFIAPAAPTAEESIAAFVRRRLGHEFLDYAIDPFVAGIYAGNPEEISVRAAFPRLHALEQTYGSLIRGQIKGRHARAQAQTRGRNAASSFSFARGMQALPDAVGAKLDDVRLHTRAVTLERSDDGGFVVRTQTGAGEQAVRARRIIVATAAHAAAELVASLAPAAAQTLARIEYAPVLSVASLYARADVQHPLDGFGFLVPRVEHRRILGTLFSSSMFPGRAPHAHVLVTTFAGGKRDPGIAALGDDEIMAVVRDELATLIGAQRPAWQEVSRWTRAIPQYTIGHLERIAVVEAAEREVAGLYFAGNYRGGVSVADCISSSHALADRVANDLPT